MNWIIVRNDNHDRALRQALDGNQNMSRFVLQLPDLQGPTYMYVHTNFNYLFMMVFGPFITEHPAPRLIPDAMLVACAPQKGDTCAICLEEAAMIEVIDVEDDNAVTYMPNPTEQAWVYLRRCNHRFHRNCVSQSQGVNCPLCRTAQTV